MKKQDTFFDTSSGIGATDYERNLGKSCPAFTLYFHLFGVVKIFTSTLLYLLNFFCQVKFATFSGND